MSNYRDDTTDTAIAVDATWAGLLAIADNTARIKELFVLAIAALSINSAVASDELTGSVVTQFQNSAVASDGVFGNLTATNTRLDSVKASDQFILKQSLVSAESMRLTEFWQGAVGSLTTDTAVFRESTNGIMRAISTAADTATANDYTASFGREIASDIAIANNQVSSKTKSFAVSKDIATVSDESFLANLVISKDTLIASDTLFTNKTTTLLSKDSMIINDALLTKHHVLSNNIATVSDSVVGKAKFKALLMDAALADDETWVNKNPVIAWVDDSAMAVDDSSGRVIALNLVDSIAVLEDGYLFNGATLGNAWTANTGTWAMSRYSDLPINRLVVINGKLYGESKNGVYQMDAGADIVDATIKTGKIDFGEVLAHPTSAYLEYELKGSASMQVQTTQSGKQQSYKYPLPRERADELTNGRILFGRGLRGRHFTFVLNISATHGYLNSLAINALSTKRRI